MRRQPVPNGMTLLATQRAFRAYLLNQPGDMISRIAGPAVNCLTVYHHAYRAQLAAVLADTYEKTRNWLGEAAFEAAASAHIAANPPTSWTLGDYGSAFSSTLGRLHPRDVEVRELADLDWALRRAFEARDEASLPVHLIAGIDWSCATIRLASSVSIHTAHTNAAALWSAMAAGQIPPAAQLLSQPARIRVWRDGLAPRFATIDAIEAEALSRLLEGVAFADMCAELAERVQVEALADMLAGWLRDGLVVALGRTA